MRAPLASMTGPGLISLTDLAVPLRRLRRADDAGIRLLQLADLRHLGATQLEWEAAEIFGKPFAFRRAGIGTMLCCSRKRSATCAGDLPWARPIRCSVSS